MTCSLTKSIHRSQFAIFGGALLITLGFNTVAVAQVIADNTGSLVFDVASVKPNRSDADSGRLNILPGGRLVITNATVRDIVRFAFQIQDYQLLDGPGWMNSEHFDISAKSESNPNDIQVRRMLQSLLAERFRLVVHRDTRDVPIYALVLARQDGKLGANLKRSETDCRAPRATQQRPCGMAMKRGADSVTLTAGSISLGMLAASLGSLVHRPTRDRTGLDGQFDVTLEWAPSQGGDASSSSLFTALSEQLGLKLESTSGPVETVIVDDVARPTPN
jgi:uncharacterized protein (TIGR03435 family)